MTTHTETQSTNLFIGGDTTMALKQVLEFLTARTGLEPVTYGFLNA